MARHYSVLCPLIMLTPLPRPITQRVNRKDVFKSCIKLFRFPARLRSPVNQVWSSLKKIQWLATAARWTTPSIFRISIFFYEVNFCKDFQNLRLQHCCTISYISRGICLTLIVNLFLDGVHYYLRYPLCAVDLFMTTTHQD